jgi:integrase
LKARKEAVSMAVLVECLCHRRQSVKNKLCKCGQDLVKLKRSNRIKYWITYRLPGGKQRRECVGDSIEEARDADGKRRVQKRENRIFDIKPETKMTFNQLKDWYLALEKTKALAYYPALKTSLNKFCSEFGDRIVSTIKPSELENLQVKRQKEGLASATIDHEIQVTKIMINKAFNDEIVGADTLRAFKRIKPLLTKDANARNRVLTPEEFERILEKMPYPGKGPFLTAFRTGMREGEILKLVWPKVDLENRVIKLEAGDTKDKEPRIIPIPGDLLAMLRHTPRVPVHDPHVFLSKGKKIGAETFREWVKKACEEAGILYGRFAKGGFVPHDLRHGFVTYMRKAGVDRSVIMELTGHSTEAMFHRYNEIDGEDRRKAMSQFESFLNNRSENVDQTVDQKS